MIINNKQNTSFCGYDVTKLRGIYMQGTRNKDERNILREIRSILHNEGLQLFLNDTNMKISDRFEPDMKFVDKALSIWGQDRKAFVVNKSGKQILWNTNEPVMLKEDLGPLSDFEINPAAYMPRGGNYYIGTTKNGEKWLLLNNEILSTYSNPSNTLTEKILENIFDVKAENIFKLKISELDLDEIVRPIGYPYILVNDYNEALINIRKMKEKFPRSVDIYSKLQTYIQEQINKDSILKYQSCDCICSKLESFGFKPIKIAARYDNGINFINALAFENKKGKISYITNSTNKTCPELKYLEDLFEQTLKSKVPEISDSYFISGGSYPEYFSKNSYRVLTDNGINPRNHIMDILSNRGGGIHCMCAEVPKF